MSDSPPCPYVSRGGLKLAAALDAFAIAPDGWLCADLGSSTGGFVDCLLQRGARHVHSVDTAYGVLAWKLRTDPRVTAIERSNALHHVPPADIRLDLLTLDLGWTRQKLAIPAALKWNPARIISLIKPHYEAPPQMVRRGSGVITDEESRLLLDQTLADIAAMSLTIAGCIPSPIRGSAGKNKSGNLEYLALILPPQAGQGGASPCEITP